MIGLINILFLLLFFVAFGRLVVELLFGHRNQFLIKVSLILMAISAGIFFSLGKLQEWMFEHPGVSVVDGSVAIVFLIGVILVGGLGLFWLKRMK